MGRVIPFSKFEDYIRECQKRTDYCAGTILDTNILISLTYEINNSHEAVLQFSETLERYELPYFTTVTTRSEFLDFRRRLLMTEHLIEAAENRMLWRLTERARSEIKTKVGLLRSRQSRKIGSDPVFTDTDLKDIKKAFSAGSVSGHHGWLSLCEAILSNRLKEAEEELEHCGIKYISQHDVAQKELFRSVIDWPEARTVVERTCLGVADAMVLNALQCSRFSFIVSTDFDVGYAVLSDSKIKDAVMPDWVANEYRHFHFDRQ